MRTDEEFADYHSRYNDDPVVQKLCEIILEGRRIEALQDEVDVLEGDLECMERDLREARYEISQLESRTLSDMARELEEKHKNQVFVIKSERDRNSALEEKIKTLNEKINIWTVMEKA